MRAALVVILPELEDGEDLPPLLQDIATKLRGIPQIEEHGKVIITIKHAAEAVIREAEVAR